MQPGAEPLHPTHARPATSGQLAPTPVAPSGAEQARTAVASAQVGVLTTYPRRPPQPLSTSVEVADDDGSILLTLADDSDAARTLAVRPLATVHVAPLGCELTWVHGAVRRVPGTSGDGTTRYRLEAGAVRIGRCGSQVVDTVAYGAAEPDPLRDEAPAVLAHLRAEHGDTLAGCLRAQGHRGVRWVEAVALDRYGLDLSVVDDHGVDSVRLTFPTPVRSVRELSPHLYLALRGPGGDGR